MTLLVRSQVNQTSISRVFCWVHLEFTSVLYARMDEYSKAEPLYQRALAMRRKLLGTQHPDYAGSLNNLGSLYRLRSLLLERTWT